MGGKPDFSNTYDNYFIIRGAYWASKRYKEEDDELKKNNNVKPEELQWIITNYGASLLKKASETYGK